MLTIPERTPDETEVLRRAIETALAGLRVACPGIIQSFDVGAQTAIVQLAIREKVNLNGNLSWVDIPLILDVPVYFPRAGGYVLTMPVAKGDECLVIFGDMCIDGWWQAGGVQNQVDKRRHDLSDAFALVGVWSQPRKIPNYSATSAQLRNDAGDTFIEVAAPNINITAAGKVTIQGRDFMNHIHHEPDGVTGGVV